MVAIRQSETPGACPVRPARSCRVQRLQSCASRCTALHPTSPLAPNTTRRVSIQWQRRHAAIARPHTAVASPCRAARPCPAARHHRLCPVHRPGFPVSGQGGKPPCPCTRSVDKRRRRATSHGVAPPLRPPAALLHKAAFHKVPGSRCANCYDPCGSPWMMEDTGGVRASTGRGRSIL